MPSSSPRSRVPVRRSPRSAPRAAAPAPAPGVRPPAVTFAVVFGGLLTVETLYLGFLLWEPNKTLDRFLVVPLLLAALTVAGSLLVFQGRRWGWAVLAVGSLLPLGAMLLLVFLLSALGGGTALWASALLLLGPLATLVLALRRPVREWCAGGRARRSAEGRRRAGAAR